MGIRYFIYMSFKGSAYHGWQYQPNAITVQMVIENALNTILDEKISITGAGRTDTGVHASFFCAHFESSKNDLNDNMVIVKRLNGFLPADISISSIKEVNKDMHARFSAISRTYKYYITTKKSPFITEYSWYLPINLDIEKMNMACEVLKTRTDFTSFSKSHTDVKTNNCKIMEAYWLKDEENIVFTIKADRFLRNMVRAIVGTMVDLGSGKTTLDDFESIIAAKDRRAAGQSVPAKGLFLVNIEYGDDLANQVRSSTSMFVQPEGETL